MDLVVERGAELLRRLTRASAKVFPIPPRLRAARTSVPLSDLLDSASSGNRSVTLEPLELAPALTIAAMSTEPVAEYGLALRAAEPAGRIVIPVGYTDSVFGYRPSARMLGQHGHEDEGFMEAFGLTGRFRPELKRVVRQAWERLGEG